MSNYFYVEPVEVNVHLINTLPVSLSPELLIAPNPVPIFNIDQNNNALTTAISVDGKVYFSPQVGISDPTSLKTISLRDGTVSSNIKDVNGSDIVLYRNISSIHDEQGNVWIQGRIDVGNGTVRIYKDAPDKLIGSSYSESITYPSRSWTTGNSIAFKGKWYQGNNTNSPIYYVTDSSGTLQTISAPTQVPYGQGSPKVFIKTLDSVIICCKVSYNSQQNTIIFSLNPDTGIHTFLTFIPNTPDELHDGVQLDKDHVLLSMRSVTGNVKKINVRNGTVEDVLLSTESNPVINFTRVYDKVLFTGNKLADGTTPCLSSFDGATIIKYNLNFYAESSNLSIYHDTSNGDLYLCALKVGEVKLAAWKIGYLKNAKIDELPKT